MRLGRRNKIVGWHSVKVLTFDCYGTLLNTDVLYEYIFDFAKRNGLHAENARQTFITYEDRLMYGEEFIPYDKLLLSILEYCDMEFNTDIFVREWGRIEQLHKDFEPHPDVLHTLEYLKKRQYELIIMSNSSYELMPYHLEKLGNLFDGVILADDTKCYKPSLKFFRDADKKFHLSEKEHCHIAMGYWWDIVPCSKLGWKKIWVNRNSNTGMKKHLPYEEVTSFVELEKLL